MSLIEQLLKQQSDRIDLLERRLAALETRTPSETRAEIKANKYTTKRDLQKEIMSMINKHWNRTKSPLQQRFISQVFSKAASKTPGGMHQLMESMERDNLIRTIRIHSGANLIFPFDGFSTLSPEAIENMTLAGLTESQKKRIRAQQNLILESSAEGPSEEELKRANAAAVAEFTKGA